MKELFNRRIAKVLPDQKSLESRLSSKKLRIYNGIDPTGTRLHLGHSIPLRKLMDFANAGHEVILLFGTGTVLVGDPSLRDKARELIKEEEIDKNIKNWKEQASKIIDFSKVEIRQNGDWIRAMTIRDIIEIGSRVSAVQLFKRESFTRRIKNGDTVWYHETMYPLLQGYDSVEMDVDLEIGGTDQEFNMLMGRELQKKINNKEKWVITTPMIVGTDGQQMSKSSGNCVWLDDEPDEMFGKIMRLPDKYMWEYLENVTDIPMTEIKEMKQEVNNGSNPVDVKYRLALDIVTQFHDVHTAEKAKSAFKRKFSKNSIQDQDYDLVKLSKAKWSIDDLIVDLGATDSKSQARRLAKQGGIRINNKRIEEGNIELRSGDKIQVGKRGFYKVK